MIAIGILLGNEIRVDLPKKHVIGIGNNLEVFVFIQNKPVRLLHYLHLTRRIDRIRRKQN